MIDLITYICAELEKRDIDYMLSGSLAMSVYTIPRMTRDVDIVIMLDKENVESFSEIFKENFYFHRPSVEEEISRQGMFNVIDFKSGFKVDFIVLKSDLYRVTEFERKRRSIVLGVEAWIVSVEDLIISKIIWANQMFSNQQIMDIENLLENTDLDREYLSFWCKKLRLDTFNFIK
jgi:hypothetical protein